MNITDNFIDYIYDFSQRTFSENEYFEAKKRLLDYIGVTFIGSKLQKEKLNKYLKYSSTSDDFSAIIGFCKRTNMVNAAFVNGFSSHVADYDDGSNAGIIHLGSPVISALISVAERFSISGEELLKGIIVGYEGAYRLANTIQPSHKLKGYHATGTCGAMGAVLGLCSALKVSKEQYKNAFTLVTLNCSATLKVLEGESELKPLNVARAASLAVDSILVSFSNFLIPHDVLMGNNGLLNIFSDDVDIKMLFRDDKLAIKKAYYKIYGSCRYTHPAIEAVLSLNEKTPIEIADIKKILVETYELAVKNHDYTNIVNSSSARMSIPYSVAIALYCKEADFSKFSDRYINNSDILNLTRKVLVKSNKEYSLNFPEKQIAKVTIYMKNNLSLEKLVEYPLGEPQNPAPFKIIQNKFFENMKFYGKSIEEATNIKEAILNVEKDYKALYKLL
jgi:2-methylcitrate dehydratase PrpD